MPAPRIILMAQATFKPKLVTTLYESHFVGTDGADLHRE